MKNKIRVSQRETMILLISLLISANLTGLHLSSQNTLEKTENMETSTQTTSSELGTTTMTTTTATSITTAKPITTITIGFKPIIVSSTSKAITKNTESVIETTVYKITECVTNIIETEVVVLTTEETPEPIIDEYTNNVGVSESEYILLCNCVAYEAGSEWISEYDKALVVEVIMNRVNSSSFPNDIYSVITQEGQFSGVWNYANLGYYVDNVSDSVKNAVNLYFENPSQFNHGYLYFEGDGSTNYFR